MDHDVNSLQGPNLVQLKLAIRVNCIVYHSLRF
jgi:hypothetical protein